MSVQLIEGFERGSNDVVPAASGANAITGFDRTPAPAGSWSRFCYSPGVSNEWIAFKDQSATHVFIMARVLIATFSRTIFRALSASLATHADVRVDATGHVTLNNSAGTVVGTSTAVVYQNAWNLIELEVTVGDTAAANVWLHGVSTADIAVASGDFKNGTETTVAAFGMPGNSGLTFDDIIVFDSSGTKWNSRVGDKVVVGLVPNAKGDQEQWDPRKTGTAARFYFPKALRTITSGGTTKDGFPAPVGVTPSSVWEYTSATETDAVPRGRLTPERYTHASPANGNVDSRPAFDVSGSAPFDLLGAQYVSPALAAQTISGTAKLYMIVAEETATDDIASQLVIRVVSNDGQTVRGTLYAGDTDATDPPSNEWATTATNRAFPRGATTSFSLSSLAISEGDRLVVELGGRMRAAGRVSVQLALITGSAAASDVAENETETGSNNAWLEFSSALTLSDDGNWDHVAELMPDDDGTYVTTNVDNDLDLYNLETFPASLAVSGPLAIQTRAKKADPGTRTITHAYKTSGATQTSSAIGLPTGAYAPQTTYYDVDGTDSADWSDSKVNALQVGPKATT